MSIPKWNGPALAYINYMGSGNFVVWNYGTDGTKIDLLVNTIGTYEGFLPLDFMEDEHTARFQVNASGKWVIWVLPLTEAHSMRIPGRFDGHGDDVVFLEGGNPDLLTANASRAKSNFVIWSYGSSGRDLLVNKIAPYSGTVVVSADSRILVVNAVGTWSIDVAAK